MAKRKRKARRKRRPSRTRLTPSPRAVEAALAGIAHDIRTPLTGVIALAELLASSDLAARERGWATSLKSGAEHIAAVANLIVDAARAERKGLAIRREPFSPRALAHAVGQGLTARAATGDVHIEVDIAGDLPDTVIGDALRLRSALENLADNALKFTRRGSVRFAAAAERGRGKRLQLVFTVSDSGIGLSAGELKRLFRPFAQASLAVSRRYGGAGLGLVFVKRVAKAMGGDLTVTSAKGAGSTFRLAVPVQPAEPGAAADAHPRSGEARPLRILCAEDNPYGRVVMNTVLTELGHSVDFVQSGEAAVEAARRGGYHVLLMDVSLSGIGGLEAARRIRALPGKAGQVPIIGISGHGEAEAAARAAGMNFYFVKPVSPRKLAEALAELRIDSSGQSAQC